MAVLFVGLTLLVVTFVFYLHANAFGVLYWRTFQGDELTCHYYSGLSFNDVTFHDSRRKCPLTRQAW
ncbi:hypothetical protein ACLBXM_01825 [Xanthobacteraceae bacterium A53D]